MHKPSAKAQSSSVGKSHGPSRPVAIARAAHGPKSATPEAHKSPTAEFGARTFATPETLLPAMIEAIADAVFVADAETRQLLFSNRTMCGLVGYSATELAKRNFCNLLTPESSADCLLLFEGITRVHDREPFIIQLQRADGIALPATLAGATLTLSGRSMVVGIIHDISPQRRTEASLRESEQKLRAIFDSVNDGIIVHALDTGAFVEVNPRVCELFGYHRDEMLALSLDALTDHPSPISQAIIRAHTARAAAGENHVFDWHVRAKDGHDFWIEIGLRRITLGAGDYILATTHDISARKRAGEALSYRDQLLHATTLGTAALVAADSLDAGMSRALQIVGEALGVDRALVIVESGPTGRPALRAVWEHAAVTAKMTTARFDTYPMDPDSLATWRDPLKAGKQVTEQLESANPAVRDLMASLENKSMLLVPIFVGGEYWGNIGLDSCRVHRDWNTTEAEVLRTFASVIGIVILRNRTHVSLQSSQAQLSEALNMARAGGWDYDVAADRFTFNDNFYSVLRTTSADVGGYQMSFDAFTQRFVHPRDVTTLRRALKVEPNLGKPGTCREFEHRVIFGDESSGSVLIRCFTVKDSHDHPVQVHGVTQDITERKRSEEALRRANRALLTLSVGSETLVRSQDESDFLTRMCGILVDVGGYATALIGLAEHDSRKTIRVAAVDGVHREVFRRDALTWDDIEAGRGPMGIAIRTGKLEINRDFRTNPKVTRWRSLARELGYACSIALPLRDHAEVFGVLSIYSKDPNAFNPEEVQLLIEFSNDLSFGITSLRSQAAREEALARLRRAMSSTVQALASTLELRDPYTAGHQRAVAKLATAIGARLGVPADELDGIGLAATIHDIGKIQVPTEILSKPGRLTPLEYQIVQTHAQAGYEIVKGVDFPWPIAEMIRQHHERIDGTGYPRGLKGTEILIGARIIAVADVVESMMSHRPYRPALGVAPALAEIERGKGTAYDEAVVDACVSLVRNEEFKF